MMKGFEINTHEKIKTAKLAVPFASAHIVIAQPDRHRRINH
ncbi:hypothetical protein NST08_12840 [Paenibacillus sp. FSL K6-1566]